MRANFEPNAGGVVVAIELAARRLIDKTPGPQENTHWQTLAILR